MMKSTGTEVCAVVTASTMADLVRARDAAYGQGADLVEMRLDSVSDPDPRGAVAGRTGPVLVTCRAAWEGGGFTGGEEHRERILAGALEAGADFVDVEVAAPCRDRLIALAAHRVVVSAHDFGGLPVDLRERFAAMRATGAAVVKIAAMTRRLSDQLPLFDLARTLPAGDRHVLIAMGEAGLASRVLSARLGNAWTYAGAAVAPGQVPLSRMLGEFDVRRLGSDSSLFGVVGRPVAHSISPAIHNAAIRAAGLDACYLPLAAEDFDDFVRVADALGVEGASVTAPFKIAALAAASRVDPLARRVGAANTLRRRAGEWEACNTDVAGFLAPLAGAELDGLRVAVLGAGGGARAVVAALRERVRSVTVHARNVASAQSVAGDFGVTAAAFPPRAGSWDLLVNTTPVGTWPDAGTSPIAAPELSGATVYDLVYNPEQTALLRAAARRGCRAIGGLEMLVAQAAEQFAWWTGHRPDVTVMRAAGRAALEATRTCVPAEA